MSDAEVIRLASCPICRAGQGRECVKQTSFFSGYFFQMYARVENMVTIHPARRNAAKATKLARNKLNRR